MQKIKVGISACLLGQEVRFDGSHKRDRFITDKLSHYFEFMAYCPEVAIGMGVPRPTIHLKQSGDNIKVVGVHKAIDVTSELRDYSINTCKKLSTLCGYILKSKSPTCGMERVKIYHDNGQSTKNGVGIFAEQLKHQHPYLPLEEEGRLNDPVLRENFIIRVYALNRWNELMSDGVESKKLIVFHTQHKLLLMSHHPVKYRELGKLLSNLKTDDINKVAKNYIFEFMHVLKYKATPVKHMNTLLHCMGYLKKLLVASDKKEMVELLNQYRNNEVPLVAPMTLIQHHFRKNPNDYMANQVYFEPYPKELGLRNHA